MKNKVCDKFENRVFVKKKNNIKLVHQFLRFACVAANRQHSPSAFPPFCLKNYDVMKIHVG